MAAPSPARRRGPRRLLLGLVLLFVGLPLAGLAARALVLRHFEGRLEAELARLRDTGEPAYPEEIITRDPGPGEDAIAWATAWDERQDELFWWDVDWTFDPLVLDDAREAGIPPARLEPLEALVRLYEDEEFDYEEWKRFLDSFRRALHDATEPLGEDQHIALRAMAAGCPFTEEDLDEIRALGRLDHGRLLEELGNEERAPEEVLAPYPEPPRGLVDFIHLGDHALVAAHQEPPEEALDHLLLSFHAAEVCEGAPVLSTGYALWCFLVQGPLYAIVPTVTALPVDANLDEVEARLAALDPRAQLVIALQGERAVLNRYFQWMRQGGAPLPGTKRLWQITGGLFGRIALLRDQLYYLGMVKEALEFTQLSGPEYLARRKEHFERVAEFPWGVPISRMAGSFPEDHLDGVFDLEARILLTRAFLVAHRDGVEAGLAWASVQTDPCDGQPVRHRIEEDGTIVLWSVGPDGVDDGAPDDLEDWGPPPDVVLRFRPR